jgi:TonB family protein
MLLPWHVLWTPKTSEPAVAAQQPPPKQPTNHESPQSDPAPVQTPTEKVSTPGDLKDPVHEESTQKSAVPPKAQDNPVSDPTQQERRPKKIPRIIASNAEQQPETITQASAQGQQPVQWRIPPPAYSEAVAQTSAQGQQSAPPPTNATEPVLLSQVQPAYTPEAREARIQGTVEILLTVRVDGTVKAEKVRKSLDPGLDASAMAAVEQWTFRPATKDGKPVAAMISVLINFALR